MPKKHVGKKPKRRLVIRTGRLSGFRLGGRTDYCSKRLRPDSLERAEKAQSDGMLFLVDDQLLCECGARVGARQSPMGTYLEPSLHYPYKRPPSPPRKRDQGKRSSR